MGKSTAAFLVKTYGFVACVYSLSYFYSELAFASVFGPGRFAQGYTYAIAHILFLLSGLAILLPVRAFVPFIYYALVYSVTDCLNYLHHSLTGEIITIQGEFWQNWKDCIITASFALLYLSLLALMFRRNVREPFFHMSRARALSHIALSAIVSTIILAPYNPRDFN